MKLILCVAGFKGLEFLDSITAADNHFTVISYQQNNTCDQAFEKIRTLCEQRQYKFIESSKPTFSDLEPFDMVVAIGWQYLFKELDDRIVVFHDSLLPKYRGYAPTVAALINGDTTIGVSAIRPAEGMDTGPIIDQEATPITYPITIGEAFEKLTPCTINIFDRLVAQFDGQPLTFTVTPQNESEASYSIWRDEEDQHINWSANNQYIQRLIHALTPPYTGARSRYNGAEIIIHDATIIPDENFVERHTGKIWKIEHGKPHIICGQGLLRLDHVTDMQQQPVTFTRIRQRLG